MNTAAKKLSVAIPFRNACGHRLHAHRRRFRQKSARQDPLRRENNLPRAIHRPLYRTKNRNRGHFAGKTLYALRNARRAEKPKRRRCNVLNLMRPENNLRRAIHCPRCRTEKRNRGHFGGKTLYAVRNTGGGAPIARACVRKNRTGGGAPRKTPYTLRMPPIQRHLRRRPKAKALDDQCWKKSSRETPLGAPLSHHRAYGSRTTAVSDRVQRHEAIHQAPQPQAVTEPVIRHRPLRLLAERSAPPPLP